MNFEEKMISMMEAIQSDISTLKTDLQDVKSDLQDVKDRIIIIEQDHGLQLKALFDGHYVAMDYAEDIRSDVRKIYRMLDRNQTDILSLKLRQHKSSL